MDLTAGLPLGFDMGEVIQFEYHPEGCSPVIIDTLDVGTFDNLGLLYEEFLDDDDDDDVEQSAEVELAESAESAESAEFAESAEGEVEVVEEVEEISREVASPEAEKDDRQWLIVEKSRVEMKSREELKQFVMSTKNKNTVRKTNQVSVSRVKLMSIINDFNTVKSNSFFTS